MQAPPATNGLAPTTPSSRGSKPSSGSQLVFNPDGYAGVNIHLERGNLVELRRQPPALYDGLRHDQGRHFDPARGTVSHYMVWANAYDGGTSKRGLDGHPPLPISS